MTALFRSLLVLCSLLPLVASAADGGARVERIKLAVLDLKANGVPPELASSIGGAIATELDRLDVFAIISRDEIRTMLSFEAEKQALGCDEGASCLADLGGALGVRYLVSGGIGKVGESYSLQLVLTDIEKAKVDGRVNQNVDNQTKLLEASARAAQQLVARILSDRQATLIVTTEERGAVVKIDGRNVGATPLPRQTITWGPHTLEVEKQGFITAIEDFTVNTKGVVEKRMSLIPSPDFLQAYDAQSGRMRLGAWITTGGAALTLATAVFFQVQYGVTAGQFDSKYTIYKDKEDKPDGTGWTSFDERKAAYDDLKQLKATAEGALTGARVFVGVGALLAAGAAFFWIAGEDPDKYIRYRDLLTAPPTDGAAPAPAATSLRLLIPSVDVVPTNGGAYANLRWSLPE